MPALSKFQGVTAQGGPSRRSLIASELSALGLDPLIKRHQAELAALFGSNLTTLEHYQGLVSRLNAVIADRTSVCDLTLIYLETEGGASAYDEDFNYHHRDYWVTRVADESLTLTGRTFGDANPTILSAADPLNLRLDTAGNLRTDVLLLDCDHGTNETTTDAAGPVYVISANTATTPGGTNKSPSSFFVSTGISYRYQFIGKWSSLNEFGGSGGRVRFLDDAAGATPQATTEEKTITVYVRYSDLNVIDSSLYFGKRPGKYDARRVIIRGYPSDAVPVVRMGVETPGNNTVTELPSIRTGQSGADQARNNLCVRWLDCVGNRDHAGYNGGAAGLCYSQTLFYFGSTSSGHSIRYCKLRDFQPIHPANAAAGDFPEFVDVAWGGRSAWTYNYYGVHSGGENFEFSHNYVRAAVYDPEDPIPFLEYSDASDEHVYSRGVHVDGASNQTIAYNTLEGFCSGDYVRVVGRTGASTTDIWVHHNVITCNGYSSLILMPGDALTESISGLVEKNFIYNCATDGVQTYGGQLISAYGQGITIRHNLLANNIDGQVQRSTLTSISGLRIDTVDTFGVGTSGRGVNAYENVLYRAKIQLGNNAGWTLSQSLLNTNQIVRNIGYDIPLPHKEGGSLDARRDGSILVEFPTTNLGTNIISSNNFSRPASDKNRTVSLLIRNGASGTTYSQFTADDTLPGYQGTTVHDPQFTDATNGDFHINNPILREWLPDDFPWTREATGAWTGSWS